MAGRPLAPRTAPRPSRAALPPSEDWRSSGHGPAVRAGAAASSRRRRGGAAARSHFGGARARPFSQGAATAQGRELLWRMPALPASLRRVARSRERPCGSDAVAWLCPEERPQVGGAADGGAGPDAQGRGRAPGTGLRLHRAQAVRRSRHHDTGQLHVTPGLACSAPLRWPRTLNGRGLPVITGDAVSRLLPRTGQSCARRAAQ